MTFDMLVKSLFAEDDGSIDRDMYGPDIEMLRRGWDARGKVKAICATCENCGFTMLYESTIRSDELECWQCGSRDVTLSAS
mgnify:CR=1 FL=1